MKLTKEEIVFAKSIGATHYCEDRYWKGGGIDEAGDPCPYCWKNNNWVPDPGYYDVDSPLSVWATYKIDFSDTHEWGDFQLAVEKLVDYCNNSGIMCDELDTVGRMLEGMCK